MSAAGYNVTITAGSNMTKTTGSGAASQTGLSGAMTDVVYTADDGYYFPTNYSVVSVNGISVSRNSYTQITVSGTPTADAAITLLAPTAKTDQTAPTGLTATKASSSTATDGKISGVTSAMEYQKSGDSAWTAVGASKTEITGLTSGTYKVRYAGTAEKNTSPETTVTIGVKEDQTAPTGLTATKASSSTATDGKISGVTSAMEYQKNGTSTWTTVENNKTEITGLTSGTYKVRYAGTADKNASPETTVTIGVKEDQTAPTGLTATKASSNTATDGKIGGVTSAMEYQKSGDSAWTSVENNKTEITGLTAGTYKVRYAGTSDKNASPETTVTIGVKENQTAPTGLTATKASSSTATDGKISGVNDDMEYQIDGASTWITVGAGKTEITGLTSGTYKVRYVGTADKNASPAVTVEVGVKVAPIVTAPTAKTLTYDGSVQALVNAGITTGGTLNYAVSTNSATAPSTGWSASIPTATDAGTYYVWYKVVGDADHNDTTPVCEAVTIAEPDKTQLNAAIQEAENFYNSISGNSIYKEVASTLKEAITTAKAIAQSSTVTEENIASAIGTISTAKKTAENARKEVDDTEAAKDAEEKIMSLPSDDKVTTDDKAAIEAARKAYDELTADQKKKVSADSLKKLTDAQAALKTAEAKDKAAKELEAAKAEAQVAMNEQVTVTQKGNKFTVKWKKSSSADGYYVYASYCGKKAAKPAKTIKKNTTTKVTISKINGKKINQKKNFHVYVVPYKIIDGKKVTLGKSTVEHLVGSKNAKYSNVKKLTLTKSKYTVKVGKTAKIKAKVTLVNKNKKHISKGHGDKFRYKSSDTGIATVDKNGKIKGIKKGTCTIYVYSINGLMKKAKVTIK